jgi:hypothetical protein
MGYTHISNQLPRGMEVIMDEKQEIKIYKNYRAMMKKRNKSNGGYPAYWKQAAREACVKRYNVSFQEVKRIVEKYDAINGITHEKQPDPAYNPVNNPQDHVPHFENFPHLMPKIFSNKNAE